MKNNKYVCIHKSNSWNRTQVIPNKKLFGFIPIGKKRNVITVPGPKKDDIVTVIGNKTDEDGFYFQLKEWPSEIYGFYHHTHFRKLESESDEKEIEETIKTILPDEVHLLN